MKKNALASLLLAFATAFALADNLGTASIVGDLSSTNDHVYTADQADAVFATRVPTSRTVNGHVLTGDVTIGESDIAVTPGQMSTSLAAWLDMADPMLGMLPSPSSSDVLSVNRESGAVGKGPGTTPVADLNVNGTNVIASIQSVQAISATAVQSVKISGSGTELKSGTTATIPVASTSAAGVVQLSTSTNGTSTSKAATESAVKSAIDSAKAYTDSAVAAGSYTHPSYTARTGKPTANASPTWGGTFTVSQIKSDATGHVTDAVDHTITIPNAVATTSAAGLMSADDKTALDSLSSGTVLKTTVSAALTAQGISSADNIDTLNKTIAELKKIIAVLEALD